MPQAIADKHELRIAMATMRYNCHMLKAMGGLNHLEAVQTIVRITGRMYRPVPQRCTCEVPGK